MAAAEPGPDLLRAGGPGGAGWAGLGRKRRRPDLPPPRRGRNARHNDARLGAGVAGTSSVLFLPRRVYDSVVDV
jgi:hypothetical protein